LPWLAVTSGLDNDFARLINACDCVRY